MLSKGINKQEIHKAINSNKNMSSDMRCKQENHAHKEWHALTTHPVEIYDINMQASYAADLLY